MTVTVYCGQFSIEDRGSGAASLGECSRKTWMTRREIVAGPAEECDVAAVLVDLDELCIAWTGTMRVTNTEGCGLSLTAAAFEELTK